MQLGLTTVRLVLVNLVHCFNFDLPSGLLPNELDMTETFRQSLSKTKHLLVVPTYRLHDLTFIEIWFCIWCVYTIVLKILA
ncbi:hypothetical protein EV2_016310 [Malus domestica]